MINDILKKYNFKKTMLLIGAILSFIIAILIVILPKPQKSTYNDFDNIMNKNGCNVKTLQDENGNIIHYTTESEEDNCHFNVKYIEYNKRMDAKKEFDMLITDVNDNENVKGSSNITINLFTFFFERATNGDNYKSANIYNNAVLYIKCPRKYRNKALEIKDDLCFYWEPRWVCLLLFIIPYYLYIEYLDYKKKQIQ